VSLRPTLVTPNSVAQAAAEAAEKRRKTAESRRMALGRLADAVRDARALGLAGAWKVGIVDDSTPTQPPSLTLALADAEIGRELTAFIFGAD